MCPLYKTIGMMKCIICYHDAAKKAILESSAEHKITYSLVYNQTKAQMIKLT